MTTEMSNHALQRTRRERSGCNRGLPCAGSLSFCRYPNSGSLGKAARSVANEASMVRARRNTKQVGFQN